MPKRVIVWKFFHGAKIFRKTTQMLFLLLAEIQTALFIVQISLKTALFLVQFKNVYLQK